MLEQKERLKSNILDSFDPAHEESDDGDIFKD